MEDDKKAHQPEPNQPKPTEDQQEKRKEADPDFGDAGGEPGEGRTGTEKGTTDS